MEEQKRDFKGVWIPKSVVENENLTLVEKWLYAEISSFEVCYMTNETLAKRCGVGERTISRSIKKLKDLGYVVDTGFNGRKRELKAKYDAEMSSQPSQNGEAGSPKWRGRVDNLARQHRQIGDIEYNIDNKLENNENTSNEVALVLDLFKPIDPTYTRFFKNTTERNACKELLKTFSLEEIKLRIDFLQIYNKLPFISTYNKVYKPSDLLRNWAIMEDNMVTAQNQKKTNFREIIR